jgi:hypothetical protein
VSYNGDLFSMARNLVCQGPEAGSFLCVDSSMEKILITDWFVELIWETFFC